MCGTILGSDVVPDVRKSTPGAKAGARALSPGRPPDSARRLNVPAGAVGSARMRRTLRPDARAASTTGSSRESGNDRIDAQIFQRLPLDREIRLRVKPRALACGHQRKQGDGELGALRQGYCDPAVTVMVDPGFCQRLQCGFDLSEQQAVGQASRPGAAMATFSGARRANVAMTSTIDAAVSPVVSNLPCVDG